MSVAGKKSELLNLGRWQVAGISLVLAAITFAVFGQTTRFEFVNFDDDTFYENAQVTCGLSLKGIAWIFTHMDCNFYHPLTMLSFMADYQIYGLHAGGYHLTNVLFHTASVILLFLILRQMTGALWRSAFVAAVFAVHPLRVESVAWVTGRKDVISTFFFMLTLGAYIRYTCKPNSLARYLMVAAAFLLALLSKPSVMMLPFVLLLLDYWPLQRFEARAGAEKNREYLRNFKLILEKIPLLALATGAYIVTLLAQKNNIAGQASVAMPLRLGNAVVSYAVYLRQMICPEGLAPFYPQPEKGYSVWTVTLSLLLLGLITGGVWAFGRRRRWLIVGWLWYLGMLTPVIGLVQVGAFAHADRYTYLPQIGLYVALTWLLADWWASRVALGGLMAGVLAVLMVCAWKQTSYWKTSETLWRRTLACTADNDVAHYDLGNVLLQKGSVDEAIAHYQKALQIRPNYALAQCNLGNAFLEKGQVDEAIAHFQKALLIEPDYVQACYNLGLALDRKGKVDEAISHLQRALIIQTNFAEAHNNLGNLLMRKGKVDEAISHYQSALQTEPDYAKAHNNLGIALFQQGKVDEAIIHYQKALENHPDNAAAHYNLGNSYIQKGRMAEAIAEFKTALRLQPNNIQTQKQLADALLKTGKAPEAIAYCEAVVKAEPEDAQSRFTLGGACLAGNRPEQALASFKEAERLAPDAAQCLNALAWLYATCPKAEIRNGAEAVRLATRACAITKRHDTEMLDTLAAAYAEAGRFAEAIKTTEEIRALALSDHDTSTAAMAQQRLELYHAGKPYRNQQ